MVADGGVPAKTASVVVEIEILHNFREPEFEQGRYNATVLENIPLGTSIAQVTAVDLDVQVKKMCS